MKSTTTPSKFGAVIAVRGSVVDIWFDPPLPDIYTLLHAKDGEIAIEVLAYRDGLRDIEACLRSWAASSTTWGFTAAWRVPL